MAEKITQSRLNQFHLNFDVSPLLVPTSITSGVMSEHFHVSHIRKTANSHRTTTMIRTPKADSFISAEEGRPVLAPLIEDSTAAET
jgi:hypothetical protein